jgi:hypothetical protein
MGERDIYDDLKTLRLVDDDGYRVVWTGPATRIDAERKRNRDATSRDPDAAGTIRATGAVLRLLSDPALVNAIHHLAEQIRAARNERERAAVMTLRNESLSKLAGAADSTLHQDAGVRQRKGTCARCHGTNRDLVEAPPVSIYDADSDDLEHAEPITSRPVRMCRKCREWQAIHWTTVVRPRQAALANRWYGSSPVERTIINREALREQLAELFGRGKTRIAIRHLGFEISDFQKAA